jgi:hypothetical protein
MGFAIGVWLGLAAAQGIALDANYVVPGQTAVLTVSGAAPGESVRFVRSFQGVGNGICPAVLGGLCVDLRNVTYLGSSQANGEGVATMNMAIPSTAPLGAEVSFQAFIARGQGGVNSVKTEVVSEIVAESFRLSPSIDGDVSDFPAETWFDADGGSWAVAYDDTHVYFAVAHPDVGASPEHWVVLYFGQASSVAMTGVQHGSQTPGLATPASTALRWKADGSYDGLLTWDANNQAWVETPFYLGTDGSSVTYNTSSDVVEFALPKAVVGPNLFTVQGAWVYEGQGFESTYAALPSSAFLNGYDADFTDFLSIDRRSSYGPAAQ